MPLNSSQIKHNKIVDESINLMDSSEKVTVNKINAILEKYKIDINYDDGLLLVNALSAINYRAVRLILKLGGNPNLIMNDDLIMEMETEDKIRMDGILRSFGYIMEWP